MDAVSDRDFALGFLHAATTAAVHASRLAEDLVLFSSREFGFVRLPDAFTTGSSAMPQKRNPDACELAARKAARAARPLHRPRRRRSSGLPRGYNKDLQEDKEALFDAYDTLKGVASARSPARCAAWRFDAARARASLAGWILARSWPSGWPTGLPFRDAYELVARAVQAQGAEGRLEDLTPRPGRALGFAPEVVRGLSLESALARRAAWRNRPGARGRGARGRARLARRGGCPVSEGHGTGLRGRDHPQDRQRRDAREGRRGRARARARADGRPGQGQRFVADACGGAGAAAARAAEARREPWRGSSADWRWRRRWRSGSCEVGAIARFVSPLRSMPNAMRALRQSSMRSQPAPCAKPRRGLARFLRDRDLSSGSARARARPIVTLSCVPASGNDHAPVGLDLLDVHHLARGRPPTAPGDLRADDGAARWPRSCK
jgi:hypothetical protein